MIASKQPHVDLARQYALDVLSFKQPASLLVQLACQRFIDDLQATEDPQSTYRFSIRAAERVCRFAETFNHTKAEWAGQPLRLEPWQCFIYVNAFGFLERASGVRRFREVMIVCPRKNGKTLLSAPVALYMLSQDGEHGAEVYCGATTEKQAFEIFTPARIMASKNRQYADHYGVETSAMSIFQQHDNSRIQPLTGDPGDGQSPSCCLVDEYHEHTSSALYDTMQTGMGARRQPLMWVITTAGTSLDGPCYDAVLQGRKVLEGTIANDRLFYVEWGIDPGDDWSDPKNLIKANPNYGISVKADYLLQRQTEAVNNPRKVTHFRTKHLNQWVNSSQAYFNMMNWNQPRNHDTGLGCYDESLNLSDFQGQPCVIGMDLASKQDIAAMVVLFPGEDGHYTTFGQFYLPEDVTSNPDRTNYGVWVEQGRLIGTPGNMIDHQRIFDDLAGLVQLLDVREIVFDPAQANWMMGRAGELGVDVYQIHQNRVEFSEPMRQIAALVDAGKMHHNAAPQDPFSWMISNVTNRTDDRDFDYPRKDRSDNKIDGAVALIMAMNRAMIMDTQAVEQFCYVYDPNAK